MKNKLLVGLSIITIAVGAKEVYANGLNRPGGGPVNPNKIEINQNFNQDNESWFKNRMEERRSEIKAYLDNGVISQKEYDNWMKKFEEMEVYHRDNNYENNRFNQCGLGYGQEFRNEFSSRGRNGFGNCGGGFRRGLNNRNFNQVEIGK